MLLSSNNDLNDYDELSGNTWVILPLDDDADHFVMLHCTYTV